MAEGGNNGTGSKWVFVEKDERTMSNHAYYLGKILRMDHPEMKSIPKIDDRVYCGS